MLDKLTGIEDRYEELGRLLIEVGDDYQRLAELAKERSGLEPLVTKTAAYRQALDKLEEARSLLGAARGVRVLDDPCVSLYPQPWVAAGQDNVFVGRIREDQVYEYGLAFWIAADNLRKGSALNALQIAELVIEQGWL